VGQLQTWELRSAERTQPRHELVAGQIEAFVDVLQAVVGDGLAADERAEDPGRFIASRKAGSSAASMVICV